MKIEIGAMEIYMLFMWLGFQDCRTSGWTTNDLSTIQIIRIIRDWFLESFKKELENAS